MSLAGIDLGTRTIVVAVPDGQGNPQILANRAGELLSTSAVYFDEDRILVGTEALNAGLLDPEFLVQDAKRHIGTDKVLACGRDGTEYCARDIMRLLLVDLRENFEQRTGELLKEVAISVPANWNDRQKKEVEDAAAAAGIAEVVLLPHEPTAAICGNNAHKRGDGHYFVLDLGGGTFDVTIATVAGDGIEVLVTNGEAQLGGIDFNAELMNIVLDRFESQHGFRPGVEGHALELSELHHRVEQAKCSLSVRKCAPMLLNIACKSLSCEVGRDEFESRTAHLIERALDCAARTLEEAGLQPEDLVEVLAVGGASQMPAFLEGIEKRFGRKASFHGEPNLAVARGALIMGRLEKERRGEQLVVGGRRIPSLRLRMRDVTAHAFGISLLDDDDQLVNNVLLAKGRPIPSEHRAAFRLAEPGQREALITILQGTDGARHEDCLELGHFELVDLEPVDDRPHRIDICLRIDRNGRLSAEALDPNCGKRADMELAYTRD